jgi:hypothetical protein
VLLALIIAAAAAAPPAPADHVATLATLIGALAALIGAFTGFVALARRHKHKAPKTTADQDDADDVSIDPFVAARKHVRELERALDTTGQTVKDLEHQLRTCRRERDQEHTARVTAESARDEGTAGLRRAEGERDQERAAHNLALVTIGALESRIAELRKDTRDRRHPQP